MAGVIYNKDPELDFLLSSGHDILTKLKKDYTKKSSLVPAYIIVTNQDATLFIQILHSTRKCNTLI